MGIPKTAVFIVGTDTEVGKTYQACKLVRHMVQSGLCVGVYKPAASGINENQMSDPQLLREATGQDWPLERVCPQQFAAAVAPPVAAELEGRRIDDDLLLSGVDWWQDRCDALIVEGAGGLMSPISASSTVLDLAQRLGFPLILVAANKLGVVNHTLLSLQAARHRQLQVLGIVLNRIPTTDSQDESMPTNANLIGQFASSERIVDSIVDLAALL
jgi:dethiobiotin synthetase